MKMDSPTRNKFGAVVLIAGGFVFAFAFIPMALSILQDGAITYAKRGFPPKTVSPGNGAFEFYYQVAFFLTLGVYPLLFSLGGIMATSVLGLNRLGIGKRGFLPTLLIFFAKICFFLGIAIGFAWVALLAFRFWLL